MVRSRKMCGFTRLVHKSFEMFLAPRDGLDSLKAQSSDKEMSINKLIYRGLFFLLQQPIVI